MTAQRMRFNPAPGWPAPPAGWLPEPGWTPDPSWPPAPPDWPLLVADVVVSPLGRVGVIDQAAARAPTPAAPLYAKGHSGQITFDGQFITLTRKGFVARTQVGKGEKRIPLASVTSVQWKPAVLEGYIQFSLAGGNETRSKFGRQTRDARTDENSVSFTKGQQPGFERLRTAIENAIAERYAPTAVVAPVAAAPDLADQLARLADLRDRGVLTDEEFQVQKARLLE